MFSITPLLFDAPSLRNHLEYRHKPYIARNYNHWVTFLSLKVYINHHSNLHGELRTKDALVLKRSAYDPSRSSKVVDFGTNRKRAYDFLFDLNINSNLGPILPRFRDITAFVRRKPHFSHTPISAKISGCSPWSIDPWRLGCKERTSHANWSWNYFRRIPTYVITIHQRHRQTTDRRHAIARPLCTKVHRAVIIHTYLVALLPRRLAAKVEAIKCCILSVRPSVRLVHKIYSKSECRETSNLLERQCRT